MLGVIISQLFTLQKAISPDPHLGYFVTGKPLGAICQGAAMVTLMLGTFRWWRQQNAITRGKALAGGFELTLIGLLVLLVSPFLIRQRACLRVGISCASSASASLWRLRYERG